MAQPHVFSRTDPFESSKIFAPEETPSHPGFLIRVTYKAVPFLIGGGTLDVLISYADPRDAYLAGLELLDAPPTAFADRLMGFCIFAGYVAERIGPALDAERLRGRAA